MLRSGLVVGAGCHSVNVRAGKPRAPLDGAYGCKQMVPWSYPRAFLMFITFFLLEKNLLWVNYAFDFGVFLNPYFHAK